MLWRHYPSLHLLDIERMKPEEFATRMKSASLNYLDRERLAIMTAWNTRLANSVDKDGKYIIQDFETLSNYFEKEARILGNKTAQETKQEQKVIQLKERAKRALRAKEQAKTLIEKGDYEKWRQTIQ